MKYLLSKYEGIPNRTLNEIIRIDDDIFFFLDSNGLKNTSIVLSIDSLGTYISSNKLSYL